MKKYVSLTFAALLLSLALSGCGSNNVPQTPPSVQTDDGEQQNASKEPQIGLQQFSTEDFQGNAITQDILADYDLTMVNIWATWCGYCIEEMPELQKLSESLPENVNLITICTDAEQNKDLAEKILEQSNATFLTLMGSSSLEEGLTRYVTGFPSTVFVDKEGNLVGQGISGVPAQGADIAPAYLKLIEDCLASMKE